MAITDSAYPYLGKCTIGSSVVDVGSITPSPQFTNYITHLEMSFPLQKLVEQGKLSFGAVGLDRSNCYAGFNPAIKGQYVGSTTHCRLKPDSQGGWNKPLVEQQTCGTVNYRMMMFVNNGITQGHMVCNWSTPSQEWTDRRTQTINTKSSNISVPKYGAERLNSPYYRNGDYSIPYRACAIRDCDLFNFILYPTFIVQTLTIKIVDGSADSKLSGNVGASSALYTYKDLTEYTGNLSQTICDALWGQGYYDETTGNTGTTSGENWTEHRIYRLLGISIKTYYGYVKSSYNEQTGAYIVLAGARYELNSSSMSNWQFPDGFDWGYSFNANSMTFCVLAESYNPYTKSIWYDTIPGLYWGGADNGRCTKLCPTRLAYKYPNFGIVDTYNGAYTPIENNGNDYLADTIVYSDAGETSFVAIGKTNYNPPARKEAITTAYKCYSNGCIYDYSSNTNVRFCLSDSYGDYYSGSDLWSTLASLGMYVGLTEQACQKGRINPVQGVNTPDILLGHMLEDGTTDGTFVSGDAILEEPHHDWTNPTDKTPYKPVIPSGGGGSGDNTPGSGVDDDSNIDGKTRPDFTNIANISTSPFTQFYVVSSSGLAGIANLLSSADISFWQAIGTVADDTQANLLDYIISCRYYPCNFTTTGNKKLKFGFKAGCELDVTLPTLGNTAHVFDFGRCAVPYFEGNEPTFLDYEPYSKIEIVLPFVGTFELPCMLTRGQTIFCTYIVDVTTGMCTAYVWSSSDILLVTASGKIGVDVPVAGNDVVTQSERIASSVINTASTAITGGLGVADSAISLAEAVPNMKDDPATFGHALTGTATSVVNTIANVAQSSLNMHMASRAVPVKIGSGSGFGIMGQPKQPVIRIHNPNRRVPDTYGRETGFPYVLSNTIGSQSGFIICNNPDLSGVPATGQELALIRQQLASGVIV